MQDEKLSSAFDELKKVNEGVRVLGGSGSGEGVFFFLSLSLL